MKHQLFAAVDRPCSRLIKCAGLGVIALGFTGLLSAQLIPGLLSLEGPSSGPGPISESTVPNNGAFGRAVAVHEDTMVVGAPWVGFETSSGRAFVYVRSGGVWSLQQELIPTVNNYHAFGWAVDVEGDTIVVGAFGESDFEGALYVFERNGVTWTQTAAKSVAVGSGYFADAVSLSGDRIVSATIADTSFRGAVYVYERDFGGAGNWGESARIIAPDAANGDEFGCSVALNGDTLVVGAEWDDDKGLNSGSAYVFTHSGGSWTFQQKLTASNGAASRRFGTTVAVEGDVAAVGGVSGTDTLYMFTRSGAAWSETRKFANQGWITDLDFSGDSLIAGNGDWYPDGKAELYQRGANGWNLKRTFQPPDTYYRRYGTGVAIDGVTVAIGDPNEYRPGTTTQSGIVEVYAVDYANVAGFTGYVRKLLYYPNADNTPDFQKDAAAFRYKELLYKDDAGLVYPDFSVMGSYWGPAELQRSRDAEAILLTAMARHESPAYGRLLLDIYYDRAVAETIVAKEKLVLAERARLGLSQVPPPSGFVIDNEIMHYQAALDGLRGALQLYFELFDLGALQPFEVWADSVIGVSSELFPGNLAWNAIQAQGSPKIYPDYDRWGGAWSSETEDDQREYLELGHPATTGVTAVHIYENFNPGAVDLVQVRNAANQAWQTVWSGAAVAAPPQARVFSVPFNDPGYAIDGVRIELDSPAVAGFNEIDAVSLVTLRTEAPFETPQPTFGYDLFRDLVPGIHLEPATVLIGGVPEPVTVDDSLLFTGYRDLVMLYGLLKDYGQNAWQLAHLHWANDDSATAVAIATEAQRLLLVNGSLLEGIYPALDPETESDSGLDTAVAGWRGAVADLTTLLTQIGGDNTPLGFDRNFLMLVQKFQGADPELFDSFNSIKDWLNPTQLASQLRFAQDRQAAAVASYVNFRQNFDVVQEQYEQSTVSFEFRLFEIVGARPGDPGYDAPQNNQGSEIWQQMQSIDLARLRIRRNQTEIDNLYREISIEMNRAADVQGVIIDYGNQQAKLTEEISHLRAAQAAAQAYADAFSIEPKNLNPFNIFFHAVNAGVQTGGELAIGQKEAQKERLAAGEKAKIEGIDSAARVQTLWLGMRTLVLDSQEAQILMKQEAGRMAQLLREKTELERRIKERDSNIARRYYADPIHRLTSNYDMTVANLAFDAAHKWLFFMARALEYKWNVPFATLHGGINWSADAVFKCRNADELTGLYLAMIDFDAQIEGTRIKDDFFDWFSVREEFFGYRQLNDQGQPLTYLDSVTGETVSAIEMFRRRLKRDFLDSQGQIRLRFSTVRQIPGGSFFRGARFLPDGQVDPAQRGLYLDKIRWMKIRLPGNHTTFNNVINGSLTYGGSSFIRNEQPGTSDPTRADRVINEFTEYSTRYWYRVGQQTPQNTLPGVTTMPDVWRFRESLSWPSAQMRKDSGPRLEGSAQNPDVLPSVLQIDAFRERSVAATDWQMIIPTRDLGTTILNIDQLDDVEIYFYHYAVGRP